METCSVWVLVEYDYYDFGEEVNSFFIFTTGAFFGDAAIRQHVHVAKVGVNFRFGGR